jgi:uncharacterized metal-binding protein
MQSATMPSGRVHVAVEAGLLAGCTLAGVELARRGSLATESLVAFASAFAFSMLFLSPDLDLARSGPMRRWGPLAFLWWPYAKLFRHRGISHHVLWGPLTRLLYLAVVAGGIAAGVGALVGRPLRLGRLPIDGWVVLAGVYVPNVAHAIVDAAAGAFHRRRT